jgi:hypothetical protein
MVLTIAIVHLLLRDDISSIHNLISRIIFKKQNAGSDPSLHSKSSQAISRHRDYCPLSQVHNFFLEFKEARTTKDHSIQQVHFTDRDDSLCYNDISVTVYIRAAHLLRLPWPEYEWELSGADDQSEHFLRERLLHISYALLPVLFQRYAAK